MRRSPGRRTQPYVYSLRAPAILTLIAIITPDALKLEPQTGPTAPPWFREPSARLPGCRMVLDGEIERSRRAATLNHSDQADTREPLRLLESHEAQS